MIARPEVSVIIPTYNRVSVIERSIRSVLNQKDISFELIVVDDGSVDETFEAVLNLDTQIRYFYQENQGPSAARNKGILESQAPFVAFLDSDDEWLPEKLNRQIYFFNQHPDFLICQTNEIWIRNGKRVNPMKKHQKYGGHIFEKCLPLSVVSPSCVMMRREFFRHVGFFDESLPACEDYDLWLRTSMRFPIGLLDEPSVIKYGGHLDQRSHQFEVIDRFRIKSLRKLLESHQLLDEQRRLVLEELAKKCRIVIQGSKKRNKFHEAAYYERVLEEVS